LTVDERRFPLLDQKVGGSLTEHDALDSTQLSASNTRRSAGDAARALFDAYARRDVDGIMACWAPDGIESSPLRGELAGHAALRAFFVEFYGAFPDCTAVPVRIVEQDDVAVVQHHMEGTFSGGPFDGLDANGRAWEFDSVDVIQVRDGLITRIDVFFDGMTAARQIGLLPPAGTRLEDLMKGALNLRTRLTRRKARRSSQS
jgi:steroid delta-isomerase-like uncharacterized protein